MFALILELDHTSITRTTPLIVVENSSQLAQRGFSNSYLSDVMICGGYQWPSLCHRCFARTADMQILAERPALDSDLVI